MKKVGIAVLVVIAMALSPLLVHLFVKGNDVVLSEAPMKMSLAKDEGSNDISNAKTQERETADLTLIEDASSEINGEWRGVCKKNSIHSVEDFQKTVQNDPVLSNHFSGFNWETAKIGKQDEEIFAYVSHRKGDTIKQTSKPIRLPKGDKYITDGVRVARTFCCNDINMTPSAGVPKKEPPSITMTPSAGVPKKEPPSITMIPSAGVPDEEVPSEVPPVITSLGPIPFDSSGPTPHTNVPDSQPVPEPNTMLLFGIGIAGLAAVCRKKK